MSKHKLISAVRTQQTASSLSPTNVEPKHSPDWTRHYSPLKIQNGISKRASVDQSHFEETDYETPEGPLPRRSCRV